MPDTFGALEIPVSAALPVGDPALFYIGDFLKTMLNEHAQAQFTAAELGASDVPVVRNVYYVRPNDYVLDECDLPSLFVYRPSGTVAQNAADLYEDMSLIHVTWMMPHDACRQLDPRRTFFNAIVKIVARTIRKSKDPLWVYEGDTTVRATSVEADVDSIKTSVTASTSPQTYVGVDLNGVRAGTTFAPRLPPTVTTSVVAMDDPGIPDAGEDEGTAYDVNNPILFTVVDWYGRTKVLSKRLTLPLGGETLTVQEDVASIVSIFIPGQPASVGSFEFGTGPMEGVGSSLLAAARFDMLRMGPWRHLNIQVEELNGSGDGPGRTSVFEAVEMDLIGQETEELDLSVLYSTNTGGDLDTLKRTEDEDDLLLASSELS